ncbi:hypothetical protein JOB18_035396, partial [Solea senegalensis]
PEFFTLVWILQLRRPERPPSEPRGVVLMEESSASIWKTSEADENLEFLSHGSTQWVPNSHHAGMLLARSRPEPRVKSRPVCLVKTWVAGDLNHA